MKKTITDCSHCLGGFVIADCGSFRCLNCGWTPWDWDRERPYEVKKVMVQPEQYLDATVTGKR